MAAIDVTGQRFGRLEVIERIANRGLDACFRCRCDCGKLHEVRGKHLRYGEVQSCGCFRVDAPQTHGQSKSITYADWSRIPRSELCKRWQKFEHFFEDMGVAPSLLHRIRRSDKRKPYSLRNCEWFSNAITFQGRTQGVPVWCRQLNLPLSLVRSRLAYGWSVEEALTRPSSRRGS